MCGSSLIALRCFARQGVAGAIQRGLVASDLAAAGSDAAAAGGGGGRPSRQVETMHSEGKLSTLACLLQQ